MRRKHCKLEKSSFQVLAATAAPEPCHLVFYCSRTCQVQHWRQKPAGHKQFCVTPEERRPAAVRPRKIHPNPHLGRRNCIRVRGHLLLLLRKKMNVQFASSRSTLRQRAAAPFPALTRLHFHIPCAEELRSFGISQVCPMCRAEKEKKKELPPGPQQLYADGLRLYFSLRQIVERSGDSWSRPTAAQHRTVNEVFRNWKGAADQGDADAQLTLAPMYYQGQGVPQS